MQEIIIAIHQTVSPYAEDFYFYSMIAAALFIIWSIRINK